MPTPHRLNVVGDFYVEAGCCLHCGVLREIAPALFESQDESCFVKRQPKTRDELDRMLRVIRAQDLGCVRYKGRDRAILERLREQGDEFWCDFPLSD
jgi:hypothetical protein